jgi:hypothetical protein
LPLLVPGVLSVSAIYETEYYTRKNVGRLGPCELSGSSDVADNRLSAVMNMDMLDGDFLVRRSLSSSRRESRWLRDRGMAPPH